jgi:hypothetical protein
LKDYIDSILVPRGYANESATYDRRDTKVVLTFAMPDLDEAIAQLKANSDRY